MLIPFLIELLFSCPVFGSILAFGFLQIPELCSLGLKLSSIIFSFRNGIKLLKTRFKCSYSGAKDANVMWNDQHLAE